MLFQTSRLCNLYCSIRVDGRNKAIRRATYRKLEIEKLRLAEMGVCQGCIKKTCRYLANKPRTDLVQCDSCLSEFHQYCFNFT